MTLQGDYRGAGQPGPAGGFGQHQHGGHSPGGPKPDDGSSLALQSLIWSLVAIPFAVLLFPAIIGIVLGVKGRGRSLRATGQTNGMATAGMVIGIIMLVLGIPTLLVTLVVVFAAKEFVSGAQDKLQVVQLGEFGKLTELHWHDHQSYPTELSGLPHGHRFSTDLWGRPTLYYGSETEAMLGSRGADLNDPSDDIHWSTRTKQVVRGPLPPELDQPGS